MQQIADILQFSKRNKTILQDYARRGRGYIPVNYLQKYQKHTLNALVLLSLESPAELCRFLKTSISQLEEIINTPVYEHYVIKKKRGGERHIFAPEKQLKQIQKRLNYFLQAYYLWIKPNEVHGFVINPHYLENPCNIVANAKIHTGKKYVLNIDLKDFFPSIPAKRIKNLFTSPYFNYDEQMAIALTLLTTYEAKLPTGAPTSPVLSNFVCLELDAGLRIFCRENGLQFTRYADDLTFSSDNIISQDTILDIILLIRENGFAINEKKLRIQSSSRKQTVTGLTVNEKVNVDRKLLKKIRAMLHDLTTNGIDAAAQRHFNSKAAVDSELRGRFIYRLEGYINFVGQVRGKYDFVYLKLKQPFDMMFE
ncbi:MAG: reverse transcriptase family protein [Candidatus Azobacteroides sp.]|nr:reverse transcriptase family protein [Candidatus Azobacteroides sp.]